MIDGYLYETIYKDIERNYILEDAALTNNDKIKKLILLENSRMTKEEFDKLSRKDLSNETDSLFQKYGKASYLNIGTTFLTTGLSMGLTPVMALGGLLMFYSFFNISYLLYKKLVVGKCSKLSGSSQLKCRLYVTKDTINKLEKEKQNKCRGKDKKEVEDCLNEFKKNIDKYKIELKTLTKALQLKEKEERDFIYGKN